MSIRKPIKSKKHILNGGKLIGQGSYGCVFRPMIPCKGATKRIPGKVSKFLNKTEANDEIKENSILDKIDNKFLFHFQTPKKCDFNMKYKNEPGIRNCRPFMKEDFDFTRMKLLQLSDGGMGLNVFLENTELKNKKQAYKLLLSMEPLFIGLKVMYENKFSHFDIKTLNTVIDPKTYQMKYIDFGLSDYNKNHIKTVDRNSSLYFARPVEIPLLYHYYRIDDENLAIKWLKTKHRNSYSHIIDERYVKNGSIYFSKNFKSFVDNFYRRANKNLKVVVNEVISKTDVFSVGVMCLSIFKKLTNQRFNINDMNENLNNIYQKFYTLIRYMIEPDSFVRFNGKEAYTFYELVLKKEIIDEMNKCPPNKIMNPKTKKCVLKSGKKGRQIIEKTRMSKNSKSQDSKSKLPKKKCPPNKIMNPKTKKCVLKSGRKGRQIARKIKPTTNPDNLKNIIICPPDKIINPRTNRCVLRTGKIGKELVKKQKQKPIKSTDLESIPKCKGMKESECKTAINCRYVKGKKRQYCRKK